MRFAIVLATIPVVTVGVGYALTPPPPMRVASLIGEPEGIRAQRMDDATFGLRWRPVAEMPPMRETVVEPLVLVANDPRPKVQQRRVSLRLGLCARHGMRKVNYGKRWRCRR